MATRHFLAMLEELITAPTTGAVQGFTGRAVCGLALVG